MAVEFRQIRAENVGAYLGGELGFVISRTLISNYPFRARMRPLGPIEYEPTESHVEKGICETSIEKIGLCAKCVVRKRKMCAP